MLPLASLKIGARLTLCFAVLFGLVGVSDLIAIWQFSLLSHEVNILYLVDQKSDTVERIHIDIVDYGETLQELAKSENPAGFVGEAVRLSETLSMQAETARQAIAKPGSATREDPALLAMLASIQSTLPGQTSTLVALATAGDWRAVHTRLDTQENTLGKLTASLARQVETEVGEQRERVMADTLRAQRQIFLVLPLTMLFTLTAAGFLSVVVTRTITEPLASLDHAAQALARGDFSRQVTVAGQDELANLGRVFNNSSASLRSYYSALQQSEAKFRSYIENSPIGILVADRDGHLVDFNQAAAQLLAYDPDALRQIAIHRIVSSAHQSALNDFLNLPDNGRVIGEWELLASDGRTIPVNLQGVGLHDGLAMAYLFDLTERRQAESERERLRVQFLQSQKMESVGRLAGGVAHDFNNMLTVINGYSRLLLDGMGPADPSRHHLEEINRAGEHAAAVTKQLLAFSRKQLLQPRVVDCNRVAKDIRPMLMPLLGEDVKLSVKLHEGSTSVYADPHQLEQVILNLAVNARDAMPYGGTLLIETAVVESGGSDARPHPAKANSYVMLAVTDSGVGMDEETRRHIFEPFFTTKSVGKGTGLGLSMIDGIVEQSGGYIEVESEPGRGSTFRIYLPQVADAPGDSSGPEGISVSGIGGTETVLVVEDQAEVRDYAADALRAYGYRVIEAENASEALLLYETERDAIDLVLTDVVMPNLSGRELADLLAEKRPDVRVLFMSGYTDDDILRPGALRKGTEFIQKPFSPRQLAAKVREILAVASRVARVLVADDEDGVRGFLRMVLEDGGYEVIEAGNGKEALQQIRAGRVDLLITDLVMPEQEGIETIMALRKESPGTQIIAMSGAFEGKFLRIARMLGAQVVLRKPVNAELVLAKVAELLKPQR